MKNANTGEIASWKKCQITLLRIQILFRNRRHIHFSANDSSIFGWLNGTEGRGCTLCEILHCDEFPSRTECRVYRTQKDLTGNERGENHEAPFLVYQDLCACVRAAATAICLMLMFFFLFRRKRATCCARLLNVAKIYGHHWIERERTKKHFRQCVTWIRQALSRRHVTERILLCLFY